MSVVRKFAVTRAVEDLASPRTDADAFNRGLLGARTEGPLALGQPGNLYTFALVDSGNLVSAPIEAQIAACANYAIGLISNYLSWNGTLDFVVDIRPDSQSPYPEADGIMPTVAQIAWNGSAWINQTLEECLTGIDSNAAAPDAGCTIYLAADGTIRNYGAPVWFDPDPGFAVDPDVPAGTHDFIGIYTHEIFHSLGFYQSHRAMAGPARRSRAASPISQARTRSPSTAGRSPSSPAPIIMATPRSPRSTSAAG